MCIKIQIYIIYITFPHDYDQYILFQFYTNASLCISYTKKNYSNIPRQQYTNGINQNIAIQLVIFTSCTNPTKYITTKSKIACYISYQVPKTQKTYMILFGGTSHNCMPLMSAYGAHIHMMPSLGNQMLHLYAYMRASVIYTYMYKYIFVMFKILSNFD